MLDNIYYAKAEYLNRDSYGDEDCERSVVTYSYMNYIALIIKSTMSR